MEWKYSIYPHGRALETILVRRGVTKTELGIRLGISYQGAHGFFMKPDIRVSSISKILAAVGSNWTEFGQELDLAMAKKE